ncbi:MAG: putative ABC transporter permease [Lachnospiraceae bacterium]|nr:putative ABC transporter permease [Lachnospiraceae bacterium]
MVKYTFIEWVFIFCVYSVIGFIWETVYCSTRERKLVNRGFMKGPFLPIYGFGVCTMLIAAAPFSDHILMACISGMICATVLEYITGDLMEHLFKVRYWDYSKEKFNLNGHICLGASLGWCAATFVVNVILQKPINALMQKISPSNMKIMDIVVMTIAVVDFTLSFKAAMDLRTILVRMENARHEMKLMQKRLDFVIALASEEASSKYEEFKDDISGKLDKISNTYDGMSEKFDKTLESVKSRFEYAKDNLIDLSEKIIPDSGHKVKEEIVALKDKYSASIKEYASSVNPADALKKFYIHSIIRSNPSLTSDEYKEALEELKSESEKK